MPSPSQHRGADAEQRAESRLARLGYRIIDRNWFGGGGELDRVAWDGDVLAVIEVRSRTDERHGEPAETIGPGKRSRLVRATCAYLMERFADRPVPAVRFDIVEVTPGAVRVWRDAFELDAGDRALPLF